MKIEISLLEYMQGRMGCMYLSDMHFLNAGEKLRLARNLEQIPPEAATLDEWNDALEYLADAKKAEAPDVARRQLIMYLSRGARNNSGKNKGTESSKN